MQRVLPNGCAIGCPTRSSNAADTSWQLRSKAVNRIVATIDDDGGEPRAEVRLRAAEALLNRVGLGKQETVNHNVQAVHGVVLVAA